NNPYMVRTSFTLGQQSGIIAEWAAKNGSKKVAIVQSDWAPGAEATAVFTDAFTKAGGQILETIKVPLANPELAPFLQPAADGHHPPPLVVRAREPARYLAQAVPRTRHREARKPAQRPRGHRRRHGPSRNGRFDGGRGPRRHLFRLPQFADQQGLCRRLQEGERLSPELHLARRLRRHPRDV